MASNNTPPSLFEYFSKLDQRVRKLESAPDSAQTDATLASAQAIAAQAQAVQAIATGNAAEAQAVQALTQAQSAYTLGAQSLQKNAYTITNSSNQLTAINGTGITVYSGSSSSSGARVILNSSGLAGYNSSGTATFALSSSDGSLSLTGAVFTNGTISGGSLNINGNAIINSSGYLTAYGATITGNITATSGTFTGTVYASAGSFTGAVTATSGSFTGTINATAGYFGSLSNYWSIGSSGITGYGSATISGGAISGSSITTTTGSIAGFTLSSTGMYYGSDTRLDSSGSGYSFTSLRGISVDNIGVGGGSYTWSSSGTLETSSFLISGTLYGISSAGNASFAGVTLSSITASGSSVSFSGDLNLSYLSDFRDPYAYSNTVSNAATVWISSTGQLRRSTASSERYKENITLISDVPSLDPKLLLQIPVKAFTYIQSYMPETDNRYGKMLPGFMAEDVAAIYPIAADYDDGQVETWNERFVVPGMLALIQDINTRLTKIEGANGTTNTGNNQPS